ncbi:hypothetical protein FRC16_006409, partial [Serendipita sp. 398]
RFEGRIWGRDRDREWVPKDERVEVGEVLMRGDGDRWILGICRPLSSLRSKTRQSLRPTWRRSQGRLRGFQTRVVPRVLLRIFRQSD